MFSTTFIYGNLSPLAGSNSRTFEFPVNKNCYIWLISICSFWTHMLECATANFKVTVSEIETVLYTTVYSVDY